MPSPYLTQELSNDMDRLDYMIHSARKFEEIVRLTKEVVDLNAKCRRLETQVESMEGRVVDMDTELDRKEDLTQLYQNETENLRTDNRKLRWENYDLRQENQALESKLRRTRLGLACPVCQRHCCIDCKWTVTRERPVSITTRPKSARPRALPFK
ncbi:PREDICTED: uncharacterized protein LOC106819307 [Priapulus caudatus]|uniref:Uncharacterized protein LOC106819307 n=1 Tax=Priapulus caudatus TaxID=37621 RepID=A0ABM1F4R7_PRICU|nr:PREDICTED: uncharacterized protein LOC106819307 [Priapulus caudatus]